MIIRLLSLVGAGRAVRHRICSRGTVRGGEAGPRPALSAWGSSRAVQLHDVPPRTVRPDAQSAVLRPSRVESDWGSGRNT